jgi:4-alpha-glucanotransferase
MTLTRDQKIAFAAFQLKERERHLEDIKQIDETLKELAKQGIVPTDPAPWVSLDDLKQSPLQFVANNESPLGGYWRYRLDKAFENNTQETNIHDSGTSTKRSRLPVS